MAETDLVVVGGGSAGLIAARTAAHLGASVTLVESDRLGGECLYTGCVPSKALLAAAHEGVGFDRAMARVRAAIAAIELHDSREGLEAAGVRVLSGHAVLDSAGLVRVDGRRVLARAVLIATGSSPATPHLEGLDGIEVLTSDSLWALDALPRRLAVIGGGPAGCELAQAFARLGSDVTLLGSAERLLPREDPDASEAVRSALEHDGVRVTTGSRATAVVRTGEGRAVRTASGLTVPFTHLVVATGRSPRTAGLGLVEAGIRLDKAGRVLADAGLRTANPRVWAAGDVTSRSHNTHTAGVHGAIAAQNAVLGTRRRVSPIPEPRVTFTSPEVGAVGRTTSAGAPRTFTVPHSHVDRAVAEGDPSGFTRIVLDRAGRILGGTIVGPRAGETLGELSLAVHAGLRTGDVSRTVHAYPTHSDGFWTAAILASTATLDARVPRAVVRLMRTVHSFTERRHPRA